MSKSRRTAILILCAVAVMTLAAIVFILNRDVPSDLLAAIGLVGGVAIAVVAIPNGNGKNGNGDK